MIGSKLHRHRITSIEESNKYILSCIVSNGFFIGQRVPFKWILILGITENLKVNLRLYNQVCPRLLYASCIFRVFLLLFSSDDINMFGLLTRLSKNSTFILLYSSIVYIAIIISIVTFSLASLEKVEMRYSSLIAIIDSLCMIVFIIEYIINIIYKKHKFVFSFTGILDLCVIIPFFFNTNSSFIRLFRLLRLTKLLRTVKFVADTARIKKAISDIKQELILFFILTAFIIFFAGAGIYVFEHEAQPENFSSILDGLWWALVTLTTVGYGDIFPITVAGKLFTAIVVISSLGVVAIPAGLLASSFNRIYRMDAYTKVNLLNVETDPLSQN